MKSLHSLLNPCLPTLWDPAQTPSCLPNISHPLCSALQITTGVSTAAVWMTAINPALSALWFTQLLQ